MMKNFRSNDHAIFKAISALDRDQLNSRGHARKSIHFNANAENIKAIFRSDDSPNQLRIYRVVAAWCEEFQTRFGPDKSRIDED